jgi:hypothetical protein
MVSANGAQKREQAAHDQLAGAKGQLALDADGGQPLGSSVSSAKSIGRLGSCQGSLKLVELLACCGDHLLAALCAVSLLAGATSILDHEPNLPSCDLMPLIAAALAFPSRRLQFDAQQEVAHRS